MRVRGPAGARSCRTAAAIRAAWASAARRSWARTSLRHAAPLAIPAARLSAAVRLGSAGATGGCAAGRPGSSSELP
eukprot:5718339-Alexandrium_andersonii.AAC.1